MQFLLIKKWIFFTCWDVIRYILAEWQTTSLNRGSALAAAHAASANSLQLWLWRLNSKCFWLFVHWGTDYLKGSLADIYSQCQEIQSFGPNCSSGPWNLDKWDRIHVAECQWLKVGCSAQFSHLTVSRSYLWGKRHFTYHSNFCSDRPSCPFSLRDWGSLDNEMRVNAYRADGWS